MEALRQLAISPTGFVFDPASGGTFTVNPTGRKLLEGLRDGLGLGALVELLDDEYDARGFDLRRDVLEYVRVLRENGLVPTDFELGA